MQQMDASVYHRRQPPSIIIHCLPLKLRFLPVSQAWLAQMPPLLDLAPPLFRALSLLSNWTAAAGKKALSCCGSHQYPSCLLPEAYLMSLPPSGPCGAWPLSSLCRGSIFCSSSLALLDAQLLCCSFNWLLAYLVVWPGPTSSRWHCCSPICVLREEHPALVAAWDLCGCILLFCPERGLSQMHLVSSTSCTRERDHTLCTWL